MYDSSSRCAAAFWFSSRICEPLRTTSISFCMFTFCFSRSTREALRVESNSFCSAALCAWSSACEVARWLRSVATFCFWARR